MMEIIWNGRGGQGAFTAARILGAAWSLKNEKSFALAFPSFGPERRGAPVRAFTKLDNSRINNRSEIQKCDFLIYLDDTLYSETALGVLKENGKLILNTAKQYSDPRIIAVDADKIAKNILKAAITNTAMLGVLAAVHPDITLPEIEKAIRLTMSKRIVESNITVVRAAMEAVK